jgi:hypothetical protein
VSGCAHSTSTHPASARHWPAQADLELQLRSGGHGVGSPGQRPANLLSDEPEGRYTAPLAAEAMAPPPLRPPSAAAARPGSSYLPAARSPQAPPPLHHSLGGPRSGGSGGWRYGPGPAASVRFTSQHAEQQRCEEAAETEVWQRCGERVAGVLRSSGHGLGLDAGGAALPPSHPGGSGPGRRRSTSPMRRCWELQQEAAAAVAQRAQPSFVLPPYARSGPSY